MINIERINDFLQLKNITPNEFILCMMIFHKDNSVALSYTKFYQALNEKRYGKHAENVIVEELENLEKLGYIENLNPLIDGTKYFYVHNYITTNQFEEHFLIDKYVAAEELCKTYPSRIKINMSNITPAINISIDEAAELYNKYIKGDIELHKEVIKKVEKLKKDYQGYAPQGLRKFIETRQWLYIDLDEDTGDNLKAI